MAQVENVYPHVNCISVDTFSGQTTALFGYDNRNATAIFIQVGPFNSFAPIPQNRGQTTFFLPGRHDEVFAVTWQTSTDKLVAADYDGDGRTDIAVWRPLESNWYVIQSSTNSATVRAWGESTVFNSALPAIS